MDASKEKTYSVFCRLWACATLFHLASYDHWTASLFHFLMAGAAVSLLHRPAALYRLLLLAVLQLCESIVSAPFISNHWLFTALVNLTLLHAYVYLVLSRRNFTVKCSELYSVFAPILRIELLILYFFVVFHKLNGDFLDPRTSCGVHFYLAEIERLTFLPNTPFFKTATIYVTLVVEAAIPLLLCWRPARRAGILTGLLFHTAISFNPISGFYNFSSMLFAFYLLFAPGEYVAALAARLRAMGFDTWLARWRGWSFHLRVLIAIVLVALGIAVAAIIDAHFKGPVDFILPLWAMYSAALIVLSLLMFRTAAEVMTEKGSIFSLRHYSLFLIPVLVGLNGWSPYLGLKTETSFAMYSNLRTEDGRSNHLLVPAALQVFYYQKDMVEVKRSSSGYLQSLAQRKLMLPYFELCAFLSQHPNTSVTYLRNGVKRKVRSAALDWELSGSTSLLMRKLLYFRPVAKIGPQQCSH